MVYQTIQHSSDTSATARESARTPTVAAADSRSAPHFRRPDPARLVSRRGRRRCPPADAVDLSRASRPAFDLLVPVGGAGTIGPGRTAAGNGQGGDDPMSPIAPTLQAFFTDRLTKQRQVSPRTIASYRDSLKLLLGFVAAAHRQGSQPPGLGRPRRRDWSARSSSTSKPNGTTAHAPATCG